MRQSEDSLLLGRFVRQNPWQPRPPKIEGQSAEMAKGTFGERLKRERELREVTVDEICSATRISPKFLEALENEQWDRLPGGVFGRGFVRTIARYLGLSEENLLSEYDLARGESQTAAPGKPEERIPAPPKWVPVSALFGLLLLVAGLIVGARYAWRWYAAHRAASKASANQSLQVGEVYFTANNEKGAALLLKMNTRCDGLTSPGREPSTILSEVESTLRLAPGGTTYSRTRGSITAWSGQP